MAADSFLPMLESLSAWLKKAATHAKAEKVDLVNARLAPDMYTLAQQVQQACHHARDGVSRLSGGPEVQMGKVGKSIPALATQIADTITVVRSVPASAYEGAEDRDCSIPIPDGMVISMNGLVYLRAWALPHFYFHIVTAYDILRHSGVELGKQDYLRQVGTFIGPQA
jgi:hypothetical protein